MKKENVYDIRKNKGLYFVLSEDNKTRNETDMSKAKIAIMANLYYEEDVDWYLKYLYDVASIADVYVLTPKKSILDKIFDDRIVRVEKRNRGRDISALLLYGKILHSQYEYLCFVHDKAAKDEKSVKRVKSWVENLWNNTLYSPQFVNNIIEVFQNNPNIGLLVPPEPLDLDTTTWGKHMWGSDFELTKVLCNELEISSQLDINIPPITIGTTFWCRTAALKKIFEKEWKYEDFCEEPLPDDGTLSHAIERIFAYVAQDAGYDTGTVVCSAYAEKQLLLQQEYIPKMLEILSKMVGIHSFSDVDKLTARVKPLYDFCSRYESVFLYGAGKIGRYCLNLMRMLEIQPKGFIVSEKIIEDSIEGIPVCTIDQFNCTGTFGIIITVGEKVREQIIDLLDTKGIVNYVCYTEL